MTLMTETQHQMAVIKWGQQPNIREKWPELKLLYHIPNERKCTPQQGRMFRLMGVRRGVPDLHLPVARGRYHSLYIEMKRPGGKTSDDQDWWRKQLENQGNAVVICKGWEEAVLAIEWYFGLEVATRS